MARIAVGGLQHETNTFADSRARFEDFVAADAWPGLTRGTALFDAVAGINLPIAGFIDVARADGHALVPLSWSAAQPSGFVTGDAYERLVSLLLDDLRAALPVDAVYLDLHGAMVAEHVDDADGELLARVRAVLGARVPLVASVDFHANVSARMVEAADLLIGYRTYPHVDMADTGAAVAAGLAPLLSGARFSRALAHTDFLIPLTWQCTLMEPMRSLMDLRAALECEHGAHLTLAGGFALADVAECGPAVLGYGLDPRGVRRAVEGLAFALRRAERRFAGRFWSIGEALAEAARRAPRPGHPLLLVDTQDNPGAGGDADTTSLVKAVAASGLRPAACGVLCDPQSAARAHAAGLGTTIDADVGGHRGFAGETPWSGRFRVAALGDGRFVGTGPFYRGGRFDLGPMACLERDGLSIVVASRKQQAADQAMFRHVGVEPAAQAVLVLKSSVHFRADFGPMAADVLIVRAPGPGPADPSELRYRKLREGVRTRPAP
jgi:microcystin degradation protein MlrC